ncbi:rhamnogalacturonan acetylesterase [Rhizomicrobium electricum]|uniref:Rhamnogalacturonan acetylesterase n=1 Tax=Rhizomicrobium electricum TaxID=480070 RepID=A0ABP3PNS8_9PROT|nr:rhamnogalacturonan acetylesterase [Rhizomicrobium electricum]NIJ48851.1 lysophospholipase L1-like esterase [Rhizomicrobium electricum]
MKTIFVAAMALAFLTPVSAQTSPPVAQGDEILGARSPIADPSITDRPAAKPIAPKKIVLVGDSTTQVNSGWGGAFCAYHVSAFTACVNLARGGRSTYSYRAEGSWDNALNEMRAKGYTATYVLIQFGHNDQPGKPGRSTNLETEFPANLRLYVQEARAAGAIPVLLTPLTRRNFVNGKLRDDLGLWAEKIRQVAAEMKVPLIDLYARSQAAVQGIGPAEAARLAEIPPPPEVLEAAKSGNVVVSSKLTKTEVNVEQQKAAASTPGPHGSFNQVFDYTHLGPTGALYFSAMVADGLARAVPDLSKDILP